MLEIGFGQGLATTWILNALRDNNNDAMLYTLDLLDIKGRVPQIDAQLAHRRWQIILGDARETLPLFLNVKTSQLARCSFLC